MIKTILIVPVAIFLSFGSVLSQDSLKTSLMYVNIANHKSNEQFKTAPYPFKKDPDNFDVRLFRTINNSRTSFGISFYRNIDRTMLPMAILLPAATYLYGKGYKKDYDLNTGYFLFLSEASAFAITGALKYAVKRPRPYATLESVLINERDKEDEYSFPSGHTAAAFCMATMLALRYPKYPSAYIPACVWAVLVTYGRPYLGMHYPTDLLGGIAVGTLSAVFIYSQTSWILKHWFKDSSDDQGSVNGGVVSLFAGSFVLSEIINMTILKQHKIKIGVDSKLKTPNLNIEWLF